MNTVSHTELANLLYEAAQCLIQSIPGRSTATVATIDRHVKCRQKCEMMANRLVLDSAPKYAKEAKPEAATNPAPGLQIDQAWLQDQIDTRISKTIATWLNDRAVTYWRNQFVLEKTAHWTPRDSTTEQSEPTAKRVSVGKALLDLTQQVERFKKTYQARTEIFDTTQAEAALEYIGMKVR